MKIGIFTDLHDSSQTITCGNRYNSMSLQKTQQTCSFFSDESCDLIVCLGDLTDTEETHAKEAASLKEIAAVIGSMEYVTFPACAKPKTDTIL